jgi:hypothetical protein
MDNQEMISEVIAHRVKDESLLDVVNLANMGVGLGITLLVEGQVIVGDLISGKAYFEKLAAKMLTSTGGEEIASIVSKMFGDFGKEHYDKDSKDVPLNYLHLENYAFLKGDGSLMNVSSSLMRICIEKISGYAIGKPTYL